MLTDLVRPLVYLQIQHPGKQFAWVNWGIPLLGAGALTLVIVAGLPSANLYSADGLFVKLLNFVQSLPGFFLAALAVVATFQLDSLDKKMPGVPPRVSIVYNGQLLPVDLTRRRMLCLMFSYLTVISFALTFALIVVTTFATPLRHALETANIAFDIVSLLRIGGLFLLLSALLQLITITMWGLYYMGERMHTPDT